MTRRITEIAYLMSLTGDLDEAESVLLAEQLDAVTRQGGRDILIDLSAVATVKVLALEAILRIASEVEQSGGLVMLTSRDRSIDRYELRSVEPGAPEGLFGLHAGLDMAVAELIGGSRPLGGQGR